MKRHLGGPFAWLGLLALLACNSEQLIDQTWTHEWRVANESGDSLLVMARMSHEPTGQAIVAPGQTQILARYSWFLGGPPDPSRDLECVSAYLMSGDLAFQQSPVDNARWERVDVRRYESLLTLRLTGADLSGTPLVDRCLVDAFVTE